MEVLTSHQRALPILETWTLMGSPAPIILLFTSYLFFVLKFGPKYMETRKPFNLINFTRVYNIFQVVACLGFVRYGYQNFNFSLKDTCSCLPLESNFNSWMLYKNATWWFMWLRLIEFCETVVFVLRKKQNQVSVLHIYHHISTAFIVWANVKYNPCKFPLQPEREKTKNYQTFSPKTLAYMDMHTAIINSLIHIMMYTYYLLSSFKSITHLTKPVKPFITMAQLAQLVTIIGHTVVAILPSCDASYLSYLQVVNIAVLIAFFTNFYIQSYIKKDKSKQKDT